MSDTRPRDKAADIPPTAHDEMQPHLHGQTPPGTTTGAAALASDSPAADHVRAGAKSAVRDAGPADIRDEDGSDWDVVDEGSDESFPASDPPSYSVPKAD